jgi:hypothetical protein
MRNGDKLKHLTHRHEPCVYGTVTLVGDSADMMAICKPASLPMHPCGAYNLNTLSQLLEREPLLPAQPRLYFVHRLDRVTSGLVIIAKSKFIAGKISQEIRQNNTKKVYLARVRGRFPARTEFLRRLTPEQMTPIQRDDDDEDRDTATAGDKRPRDPAPIPWSGSWLDCEDAGFAEVDGQILLRAPIAVVSHREGQHSLPSWHSLHYRIDNR